MNRFRHGILPPPLLLRQTLRQPHLRSIPGICQGRDNSLHQWISIAVRLTLQATDESMYRSFSANYIPDQMATCSIDNAIHGIMQSLDDSEVRIQYDHFVVQVAPEQLPEFYEEMSARLLDLEESVSLVAATHKSHIDHLTPEDLLAMKIDQETLKTRVQYKRIEELEIRYTQLLQKIKGHKLRLSNQWGEEWENKFGGLLPPKPSEGLLWRLAKFASSAGKDLLDLELVEGFQEIIDLRLSAHRTSKQPYIQVIDITNFERKLLNPPIEPNALPTAVESSAGAENGEADEHNGDSDRDDRGKSFNSVILSLVYKF